MSQSNSIFSGIGFILTRRRFEYKNKLYLEYWIRTDAEVVKLTTTAQEEIFFVRQEDIKKIQILLSDNRIVCKVKSLTLKTFFHEPVAGIYFHTSYHFYKAREILHNKNIICFEDDIRLADRFLMERFIYGSTKFTGENIRNSSDSYVYLQQGQLKKTNYTPTLTALSLDIECSEKAELYSIGLATENYHCVLMIGEAENQAPSWIIWCEDEADLLKKLIEKVHAFDPDIFIGWNVVNFDFRLLIQRAEHHKIPLILGRDKEPLKWRNITEEANQGFVSINGRVIIDGIDALKTATYHFNSFSLEAVSQELLGKGKLTEDPDDRMAAITRDFHENKIKLAEYNLQDCILVLDIFKHTKLIDFLILRSQLTGLELDRMGGSVAAFINLYLPKLHRAGYISPNRPADGGLASPGGYVMNSQPGLYRHVLILDFKSLYPSIIRTFKIDPMGLIEGLKHPEKSIPGYKGALFSRDKHFLPEIITTLWQQRDQAKKNKDAARSQAIKILMNSFYGVLGSGGCPFYDTRLASSITMRGHDIMQTTAKWIEDAGHQVIYGDTDSTFVWLEKVNTAKQAMKVGKELQVMINTKWQEKIKKDFALNSFLDIEFETYFSRFLMPTIRGSTMGSKKRYAGLKQTESSTELVFKGLETVRSDWTPLAKRFQSTLYGKVFAEKDNDTLEDIRTYIVTFIADTRSGLFDSELIYRKRLRRPLNLYVKNVPPHVKAARNADKKNQLLQKSLRYQNKGWITYVITTNGPEAIEHQSSPIDYEHYIEKQIRPIAEAILPFLNESFDDITRKQMGLFQ